jgi:hypothetical protein
VRLVRLVEREVEGGTLLPCWEETIALLNHRFPKKKKKNESQFTQPTERDNRRIKNERFRDLPVQR